MKRVNTFPRNDRGFLQYGDPVHCAYGESITVFESSCADTPHVWLKIADDVDGYAASAHIDRTMANEVIRRLRTWLEDTKGLA